jgi:hypothetical protein
VLRCRAEGFKSPVKYQWRFPAGVKQIGWGALQDEPTELVQPPEAGPPSWGECTATGDDKVTLHATHALVPLSVTAAPVTAKAGELITVRGAGFGPSPAGADGLWLVPAWGRAIAADPTCKGATWGAAAVSACVPASARGRTVALRVQVNEELATAPKPLVVAP